MTTGLSVRDLLIRGMLAGLFAGILALAFAVVFGEPEVDNAIAVEEANAAAEEASAPVDHTHDEDASAITRDTQKTVGLATGLAVYGIAVGGVFALVFATVQGRVVSLRPRATSTLLGAAAFVTIAVVPYIKYPATPPAVGDPDTIERRTALYLAMIAISLAAAIFATQAGRSLVRRLGGWNAALAGGAIYIVLVAAAQVLLPTVNEVAGFPADILWRFRLASLGTHLVLWTTLGLAFGALVERALLPAANQRKQPAAASI